MVDPRSLAIVGLRPDTAPTAQAWKALLDEFDQLEAAVRDDGKGLRAAITERFDQQGLDQWHLTRHLGATVGRLESAAYAAMERVERCVERFVADLPCPVGPIPRSLRELEAAQQAMGQAIRIYEDAHTIQKWLSEAADAVDRQGRVRLPEEVQSDWETALELGAEIETKQLKVALKKLRGKRDGAHLKGLQSRLAGVAMPKGFSELDLEGVQALACQAWRYHRGKKTHLLEAPLRAADWMAGQLGLPFVARHLEPYATAVFEILDRTLKASSSAECVNSVFRLGQGQSRHPDPDFVYLLAWIHNTRRFEEGRRKRKGLSPAELLGVRLPIDGWTMLLERLAKNREQRSQLN